MKKFIGNKSFYKYVLAIVFPIILQNGLNNLVNLLDNVMVGSLGTEQMSGVAIVNQLIFVYILCVFGATAGAGIFTAQYYGSGSTEGVRYTVRFKFYMCLFIGLVALVVFGFFSEPLINLFLHEGSETGDLELALYYAKQYFAIVIFAQIPNTVTQVYAGTLRETGETKIPLYSSIASVVLNAGLNYILIFGKLGMPAMGVEGAAIATVIARCVECAVIVVYTHTHTNKYPFFSKVFASFAIPKDILKKLLSKGINLLCNEALWSGVQTALLYCYSLRGLSVVAAMNITNTFNNLFSIVFLSLGSSISIIVGNLLGAGKIDEARDADNKIIALSFASCVVLGLAMALLAPLLVEFYKVEQEVKQMAVTFLIIVACFMPFHSILHATYFTLRSGGKTRLTFIFDSGFATFVSLPTAFLLAKFTAFSAPLILACVNMIDAIKLVWGIILLAKGIWLNNLVKDDQKILQETN
ncbi:MAG: MATE family efflux transporter [Clostridia bacterium]|nr:MATE family efflux transporter [Clostridia bacterium]